VAVVEVLLLLDDVDVTFTDVEVAFTEVEVVFTAVEVGFTAEIVEVGSFAVFQCPKSVNFSTVGRL
jgi:hypothetical protein